MTYTGPVHSHVCLVNVRNSSEFLRGRFQVSESNTLVEATGTELAASTETGKNVLATMWRCPFFFVAKVDGPERDVLARCFSSFL